MNISKRTSAPVLVAGALTILFAVKSAAQDVSVYAPIAPQYRLGDFTYNAPAQDGWRQVASNPGMFILVYAESMGPDQIFTRLTIIAETHSVDEENREFVEGGHWLARQSFGQQSGEREGRIVAYSPILPVGTNDVYKYTIVTKGPDEKDAFESFYVKMAADKSSYVIAKFTTSESDFQEKIYLKQFEDSLETLRIESLEVDSDDDAEEAAGESEKESEEEVSD